MDTRTFKKRLRASMDDTVRQCPKLLCMAFTIGEPQLPCAVHGLKMKERGKLYRWLQLLIWRYSNGR